MGATFSASYSARDWQLMASPDGVEWTVMHEVSGASLPTSCGVANPSPATPSPTTQPFVTGASWSQGTLEAEKWDRRD